MRVSRTIRVRPYDGTSHSTKLSLYDSGTVLTDEASATLLPALKRIFAAAAAISSSDASVDGCLLVASADAASNVRGDGSCCNGWSTCGDGCDWPGM